MIPSIPYPHDPQYPFWGLPTAQINFCEADYLFTPFIAEFANTFTNMAYIAYSLYGLHNLHRTRRLTWKPALPLIGLAGVGICSATFHMTLREIPQLADDLSMVFPTAFIALRLLTFHTQDAKTNVKISATILVALLIVYTIHLNINKPILHSFTFGIMLHFIHRRTRWLLSERVHSLRHRESLHWTALFGEVSFASGFVLWLIDRFACDLLTRAKYAVGLPWGFVFELHAWWHVLTAIGAFIFIVLVDHLTSGRVGQDNEKIFGWPAGQILRLYAGEQSSLAAESRRKEAKIE